jgi:hypothetical protein
MNQLAYHHRGSLAPNDAKASKRSEAASGARAADYVADIFFIALLAAPFMIFESPGSVPEAVVAARANPPAVVAPAAAAPVAAPPQAGSQ